jgi:Rrf2 family nitric oxide-sensitive transcriptional repressor
MRLTYFSDYAFRVLIYLALNPERRCTIQEVSDAYGISKAHLMKVVNTLARADLVVAQRGPNGGLLLARPAKQIRLGDVVRKTEDDLGLVECFRAENTCRLTPRCGLAPALGRALSVFLAELDKQTIADIVHGEEETIRQLLARPA